MFPTVCKEGTNWNKYTLVNLPEVTETHANKNAKKKQCSQKVPGVHFTPLRNNLAPPADYHVPVFRNMFLWRF